MFAVNVCVGARVSGFRGQTVDVAALGAQAYGWLPVATSRPMITPNETLTPSSLPPNNDNMEIPTFHTYKLCRPAAQTSIDAIFIQLNLSMRCHMSTCFIRTISQLSINQIFWRSLSDGIVYDIVQNSVYRATEIQQI